MIVIPAIDLRGGRCVRLFRGDPSAETVYDSDPVAIARAFEADGARRLHVVDLDAALGSGSNREVVVAICRNVAVPVQLGGGLRSIESVERALADGAARAILGTAAILDPGLVAEAVRRFGDRIAVAVDVRDGRLALHGWRDRGPRVEEAARVLRDAGVPRLVVTAVERDGTMDGPDLSLYERVLALTDRPVIASGGVRKAEDVHALRDLGLEAVVVGKALYAGTLHLSEVVRG
ncbi:MAG TPA: 1-(5-phosphoribosyl)-5-[(5-phosphoribosylamino)methylideneamino]imidazole-4-carboxamide isomerase [Actinomycetota bacterium]|nr:1-(5-phosphoribosyl)-5-[(5-phosphoribosylamino)methylideneamino]imidazole-4-carboxamide isomerase [Actinomycetota bacterium]